MNLNPFDLRGPEFLAFYVLLITLTAVVVWLLRRARESGEHGEEIAQARELSEDPYAMAFLRGGRYEVIQIALVSLIERGLLKTNDEHLVTAGMDSPEKANHPLDRAILTRFQRRTPSDPGRKAEWIFTDSAILLEADHIGEQLQSRKLLPDAEIKESRKTRILLGIVFLWLVAGLKIALAVVRGHSNIIFLILLALVSPLVLVAVSRRFRTSLGDKTYNWIQSFFSGLRERRAVLELNTTNSELTFLAAAFGLAALPTAVGGMIEPLHLHPPKATQNAWGSSCGSSCASFGGSCGGGSSCGGGGSCGGGCGGGCGGCGG